MNSEPVPGYRHNPLWDEARQRGRRAAQAGQSLQDNPYRYQRRTNPKVPPKRKPMTHWGSWAATLWDRAFQEVAP